MEVEATGASKTTAKQDKLTYHGKHCSRDTGAYLIQLYNHYAFIYTKTIYPYLGVRASETMAKTDAGRMEKYWPIINNSGKRFGIEPALIAAIISRESRAGNVLNRGWGDWDSSRGEYNAWGLMQVVINTVLLTFSYTQIITQ